jgi:SAM-dependent methyltransferase
MLVDNSVKFLGWILSNRKIKPSLRHASGRLCVNLGCGLAVLPGWINVDASLNALFAGSPSWLLRLLYGATGASRYYSIDEYRSILSNQHFAFHDLARSFPFRESSLDVIYSSHFFEHLFKMDAERLMRDAFTSLKPGGVMRIAIPDLAYAIELYRSGKKRHMLESYFFVEDLSSFLARHKYMYDFELLEEALRRAGFLRIKRCNFQQGVTPDIHLLDNRPEETLYVEAFR